MICITGIPRAALKDVRLADGALLMPMHDNSVQWRLATRASLLMRIGRDEGVIHDKFTQKGISSFVIGVLLSNET